MHPIFVLGLDCLTPNLLYDRWWNRLPNFRRLANAGTRRRMASCIPPITVPAWSVMLSGMDPGQLGLYGFRGRGAWDYQTKKIATSDTVTQPRIWDYLGKRGLRSILIGVPQTYPPPRVHGIVVGDFLASDDAPDLTQPQSFRERLDRLAGGKYQIDARDFRTNDKKALEADILAMTDARLGATVKLIKQERWDFFMTVEMGPDRMHHGFWRYADPNHRLYQAGHPLEPVLLNYYIHLDRWLGKLIEALPPNADLFIVSDHGARAMEGGLAINDWFIDQGWLKLKTLPEAPTKLTPEMIDWPNTLCWGEGGYCGRILFNLQGREPQGALAQQDLPAFKQTLIERLKTIQRPDGQPMDNRIFDPDQCYAEKRGWAPDLMVYFDNLAYRSIGTVANPQLHVQGNDTGPDDANHDINGVFLHAQVGAIEDESVESGEEAALVSIYDFTPTLLERIGLAIPSELIGKPIGL